MKRYLACLLIPLLVTGCWSRVMNTAKNVPTMADRAMLIKMAETGDVEAQYTLGKNYCCGGGIYYDNAEALHWWCAAAKQSQADAMFEIGKLYENTREIEGSAVPTDPVKAYAFYALAESRYHKEAGLFRQKVEKKLMPAQVTEAQSLAAHWPQIPCELPSTIRPDPATVEAERQSHAPDIRNHK